MVKEGYKEIRIGPKDKSIPEEWKVNKLKKIIKKRKGKRPNKLYETNNGENFIPYLSVNYLRGNDFPKWCLKDDDNKVEVKENEILMIWDGSYSGNVFMGFNGALSSTMARLKCENDINNEYLFYQLRNNFKVFQSTTIGTSVPHVAGKIFENLNIPTPEKKEQKKIASILSSVDKSIKKTDEVIEETKELKKGLMQELLTKGIGHSEFKEVKIGPKKIQVPYNWNVKSFKQVSKVNQGLQIAISKRSKNPGPNKLKYITVQHLNNPNDSKYQYYIEDPRDSVVCEKVDVLMTRTGNTGEVITNEKGVFHNNFFKIDFDKEMIKKNYLFYYLNSKLIQHVIMIFAGTTTIPDLNHGDFYSIPVLLPPIKEQKKIASILSSVDAKIKKEEEYKSKLERLKKGLMQKLLTGEIRVNTEMEV